MTDDSLLNQQLDEYRIVSPLGHGGMARVYLGLDVKLQRYAAIKVIDTPFRSDSEYVERFEREAQAIAQLQHPHIVTLYRYGESAGQLYMAMQYIDGADLGYLLHSYQADNEFMEPADILRIIRQVAQALDYAHAKGVIHRDVKPANIILDKTGWCYLSDFGLALLVEIGTRGEIFGSPHYIAPEQAISSAAAGPLSDLYALGVVLYEMVTNTIPFDAEAPLDVAMMHMSETPPPPREARPEISPVLEAMILKAIAKEPEERYQSGAELAEALEKALETTTTPAAKLSSSRTIPERVSIEAAEKPLPPIPAAVATPAPAEPAPESIPETIHTPRRISPLVLVGLAIGICATVAVLIALFWLFRRQGEDNVAESTPAATDTTAAVVQETPATAEPYPIAIPSTTGDNLLPTAEPYPIATSKMPTTEETLPSSTAHPLTETPQATSTPSSQPSPSPPAVVETPEIDNLLITVKDKDGVFVSNEGTQPFQLAPIDLSDGEILGEEWGLPSLFPGDCVVAWKDAKSDPKPPGWFNCRQVGVVLTRGGKDRFWNSGFNVTYDGVPLGVCGQDEDKCSFSIPAGDWQRIFLPIVSKE